VKPIQQQGEVANDLYLTIDEALIDKEKQGRILWSRNQLR